MRWLVDAPVDPDDARRRAAEILARREFAPPRQNPFERAFAAVGRFFARLFARLFGTFGTGGGGAGTLVAWLVVLAAIVLLLVLLVRGWRRRSAPVVVVDETVVAVAARTTAQAWRDEAAAHAAAGRWRDAVRCRYRAVEAELFERGVLAGVPGDTTGGERRQVSSRLPAVAVPFDDATDAFERAAYGPAPVDAEALALLDALDDQLGRR